MSKTLEQIELVTADESEFLRDVQTRIYSFCDTPVKAQIIYYGGEINTMSLTLEYLQDHKMLFWGATLDAVNECCENVKWRFEDASISQDDNLYITLEVDV